MKVEEAFEQLKTLVEQGKGDLPLVAKDCRSGDTNEASICSDVQKVDGTEDAGCLCDWDVDTEYVSVFVD